MEKFLSFKSFEISAETKNAADVQASEYFNDILKDATAAWKKFHETAGVITSSDEKEWMINYLKKNTKNATGIGCRITLSSAVASTRKNPWTVEDIKIEGKRDTQKKFDLVDHDTNEVLATMKSTRVDNEKAGQPILDADGVDTGRVEPETKVIRPTKIAAKELAKKMIKDGYKGQIDIREGKESIGIDPVVATVTYTPSISAKPGRYLYFGIEK